MISFVSSVWYSVLFSENRDVILEQLRAKEQERRTTLIETIKTSGAIIGAGLQTFISDPNKVMTAVRQVLCFFSLRTICRLLA